MLKEEETDGRVLLKIGQKFGRNTWKKERMGPHGGN